MPKSGSPIQAKACLARTELRVARISLTMTKQTNPNCFSHFPSRYIACALLKFCSHF